MPIPRVRRARAGAMPPRCRSRGAPVSGTGHGAAVRRAAAPGAPVGADPGRRPLLRRSGPGPARLITGRAGTAAAGTVPQPDVRDLLAGRRGGCSPAPRLRAGPRRRGPSGPPTGPWHHAVAARREGDAARAARHGSDGAAHRRRRPAPSLALAARLPLLGRVSGLDTHVGHPSARPSHHSSPPPLITIGA